MIKVMLYSMFILSIMGCEQAFKNIAKGHDFVDEYPLIDEGKRVVFGVLLSNVYLEEGKGSYPIMLKLDKDCFMMANVTKYGKASIQITPERISCQNPNTSKVLTVSDISNAYLNTKFKHSQKIPFQVYSGVRLT